MVRTEGTRFGLAHSDAREPDAPAAFVDERFRGTRRRHEEDDATSLDHQDERESWQGHGEAGHGSPQGPGEEPHRAQRAQDHGAPHHRAQDHRAARDRAPCHRQARHAAEHRPQEEPLARGEPTRKGAPVGAPFSG